VANENQQSWSHSVFASDNRVRCFPADANKACFLAGFSYASGSPGNVELMTNATKRSTIAKLAGSPAEKRLAIQMTKNEV
jgi:hypothetical protein